MTAEFYKETDDKQCFLRLINNGWLEKIPTSSIKKSYAERAAFEVVSDNKRHLSLSFQVCIPCCNGDRAFVAINKSPGKLHDKITGFLCYFKLTWL